ncbi:hypothetical protein D3C77_613600 [compost metagenome]
MRRDHAALMSVWLDVLLRSVDRISCILEGTGDEMQFPVMLQDISCSIQPLNRRFTASAACYVVIVRNINVQFAILK